MKDYSRPAAELLIFSNDLLTASGEPFNPIALCATCPSNPTHGDPNLEDCALTAQISMENRSAF